MLSVFLSCDTFQKRYDDKIVDFAWDFDNWWNRDCQKIIIIGWWTSKILNNMKILGLMLVEVWKVIKRVARGGFGGQNSKKKIIFIQNF